MTKTMGEVNHSHRDDPRNVFGEMFRRGASTTTDGGRRTTDAESMADVAHEAPDGTDANGVWTRGRKVGSPDR
ncbi:hypothetical protein [Halanaeroarchaeum sp. HSR-CO]|uniref:hypothetical protein n=1 Tax=Halanaeroarchaeum sp. HSR-CO TaxID=2866382 RepID=UPI00217E5EA2|nr:hypothetical protein [Halanaeroarchaeum sp. HSR-CO]